MSSEFQKSTLGKLITFANGKSSPERYDNGRFPVFGSNGLIGRANETNSPSASIVVGRVGSYCGSVHFSRKPCWVTDNAIRATAKDDNDPSYLFYLLKQLNLNNWRSGSGQPLINQTTLNSIEVCVPPPPAQRAIGEFICALDDRIALLRETNATLEAIAQALFKSWFVDFDPVHAKQQGIEPEGMDDATAALFPDSFEESELGLVPRGWKACTMDDVSVVGIGKTPPRKESHWFSENPEDVRWASIRDMGISGAFLSSTSEYLTNESIQRFNVRQVPNNTVLLSFKMTIGRVAITDGDMTTNEAIAHFKLDEQSPLTSEFIYLHLKQFDYTRLSSTSSIADAVNSKTVKAIPILLPDAAIVLAFQGAVSPIFERIKLIQHQAQILSALRDTLLPRLISGQLRLPEADVAHDRIAAELVVPA